MKMKDFILLGIVLLVAIIIGLAIAFFKNDKEEVIQNKNFIYMNSFTEDIIKEENYIFTNYDDYKSKFNSDELNKKDFDNNNFVVIKVLYDQCSESNILPTDYKIDGNNINVTVKYTANCGVCAPEYMYFLLKVDKSIESANVKIDYVAVNTPNCNPNVIYKPLIYIYPTKEMDVNVKLGHKELLTITYPKYENEWNVHAYPDGNLVDENGKSYYGLYWESLNSFSDVFKDGYVVKGSEVISFLEEKLSILGLNDREANEFIIYWLPRLETNKYNLIRFESLEKINEQMPLYINPKPETLIRVLMEYKPLNEKIEIKEQELTRVERRGYTVVEWGGSLIK